MSCVNHSQKQRILHIMPGSCTCNSNKPFQSCCGPLLSGEVVAKTPEQLMRSRYTAFSLGNHGQYLLDTWFPATAKGLTVKSLSKKNVEWIKLEVLSKNQKGDNASVVFNAFFHTRDSNDIQVMHETSIFKRMSGRWFYVGGEVS